MTQEEYNILVEQSQPHKKFRVNWNSFSSEDFGKTFLSKVTPITGNTFRIYD